jgi:hypothetical protein
LEFRRPGQQAVKDAGKREQTFCVDGDILAHPDTDCHRFFYFSEKRRKNFAYLMKNTQTASPEPAS